MSIETLTLDDVEEVFIKNKSEEGMEITIYGPPGVGKSTLASAFPKPFFIRLEKGIRNNPHPKTEVLNDPKLVWQQLNNLYISQHDYKSVIIDSISKLDELLEIQVMSEDPNKPNSIHEAAGGWGKGVGAVESRHRTIKALCDKLSNEKGMIVIFIAHEGQYETTTVSSSKSFLYSDIRLNRKYTNIYTYYPDVVARIGIKNFVRDGRATNIDNDVRLFDCVPNISQCSKNNLGIKEAIEFKEGENPLKDYL